ncbi:MAG: Clp protease N-terminal domain-containing protein [Hyphomicrobium sp.]|uniref:Clp protease N-terminal domain-containing protein n=1 Tax=Hyphomicrobium sp. TaxID=82 RepID=UPI0039E527D9
MTAPEIAQIPMSSELAATLARGAELAGETGAGEVTLEHLLAALCDDPDALAVLDASHINRERIKDDVIARLTQNAGPMPAVGDSLGVSVEVRRILEAAAAAARGSRRRDINGAIVLAAIVGDARSVAAQILEAHGLTFENAIRALQAALAPPREAPQPQPPVADEVLARARERVQSRSAPSLREIMKDMPRPVPPEPPMPAAPPPHVPMPEAHVPDPSFPQIPFDADISRGGSNNDAALPSAAPPEHAPVEPSPAPKTEPPRSEPPRPAAPVAEPSAQQPYPAPSAPAEPRSPIVPHPSPAPERTAFPQEPTLPLPPRPAQYAPPGGARPDPGAYPLPFPGAPHPSGPSTGANAAPPPPAPPREMFDLPPRPQPSRIQPPPIPPAPGLGGPASVQPRQTGPSPASPSPPPGAQPQFGPHGPSLSVPGPIAAPSSAGIQAPRPNLGQDPSFRPGAPVNAPATQQQPPQPQLQRRAPKRAKSVNVEAGQLAENIPRAMRVGKTVRAEVRIAKASIKSMTEGMDGGGQVWQHPIAITRAMSVRLRAPDGGFFIESASPETQWIESNLGYSSDDFASWRFLITPQSRGWSDLQIIVSARTIGADGVAAETALPDQIVEVKVRANLGRAIMRLIGWTIAAVVGGALATFGESGMTIAKTLLQKFGH